MTQEFVTLPREVMEQALTAIETTSRPLNYDHYYKAINSLRAALEQPQNHIPDAGKMVPAGWKLVPDEPTHEMLRAGRDAHYEAQKRIQDQDAWDTGGFASRDVRAAYVYRAMLDAAPLEPVVEQHTDDAAVNRFAEAMKAKLAVARDKGRGGWDDPAQCTVEYLAKLLVDHIAKGDPIDVANFAMMLHQRQADKSVLSAAAPTPPAVDHPEPAYLLRDLADDISVDALDLIAAIRDAGLGSYSINMMLPAKVCVAMCQKFEQPQGEHGPVVEHELKDVRCECCGYMTHHREHMGCIRAAQPKHEPVAWLHRCNKNPSMVELSFSKREPKLASKGYKAHPLYTQPQPAQKPLTDEQSRRIYHSATHAASLAVFMTRMDAEHQDADDKGVSGWLQEAEDRVKHRTIDAAHEIGQAAAPQQGDQEPVAWLATYTGKVGEPLVYVTSSYELAVENDRNQSPKPLYLHQQNLNCKSNQKKRLATLWGYVKAEQSSEVDMKPAAWLHTDGLGGKQAFTDEPPPGLKAKCRPLFARAIEAAHNIK